MNEIINQIKTPLKNHGFKKQSSNWRKDYGEVIGVFNFQGSQYSKDQFYINLGIYIKSLGDQKSPAINKCHIQFRIADSTYDDHLLELSLQWFQDRSSIQSTLIHAKADKAKGLVLKQVFDIVNKNTKIKT